MRPIKANYTVLAAVAITVALLLALAGCDSSGGTQPGQIAQYGISGTLVGNPGQSHSQIAVSLLRDNSILPTGIIAFGTDTLEFADTTQFEDSIYYFDTAYAFRWAGNTATVRVRDLDGINTSFAAVVPAVFSITSLIPGNGQWRATDGPVQLVWSGSFGADGYILAAVKHQSAYTGAGYSAYADLLTTAGNIPPEAFYINGGVDLDTGLYNIYVYAYAGSPDKVFSDEMLPVPIPTQLADNIDQRDLDGHFGAFTLAAFDTIRVVQQ